jgi:hypothetical protein
MLRKALILVVCVFGVLAAQVAPTTAEREKPLRPALEASDIEASLGTDWYGLYFQGKKMGFFKSTHERIGQGADAGYRESIHMNMKFVSLGQKAEMDLRETLEFDGKPPYALRRGSATETEGDKQQTFLLVRSDKGFLLTHTVGREQRTKPVPPIYYTLADALAEDVWIRRGAKPGDRIVTRSFELKDLEIDLTTSKLVATKTSLVKGVKVIYHEVESVSRKVPLACLSRHDQSGRLLSGTIAGLFEVRLETEAQAKDTQYSADLFVLGMAKIDQGLGEPRRVSGLVMEVVGKGTALFPPGPRQSLTVDASGTRTLRLGKRHGVEARATAKEIEDALRETTAYPITDPKVKALAGRAVGDATAPRDKVRRLVRFVNGFIFPELTANMPNVYDLLEHKKGDCKAYALLFTALARAAGIPAREVSGLVYMGDDQKAFGGHAWNEVVLDGVWVPVDASCRETEVDATHISFGNETQATTNMLKALGKLSFKLIEVERGE